MLGERSGLFPFSGDQLDARIGLRIGQHIPQFAAEQRRPTHQRDQRLLSQPGAPGEAAVAARAEDACG